METPLKCDECGAELGVDESGTITEVVSDGTPLSDDSGFFIAVRSAEVTDNGLRIEQADVFCADHCPDEAYEYETS